MTGLVIVVDMLGLAVADRARTALRLDHGVEVGAGDAIPPPKVVFPGASVQALVGLFALCVVAGLAVAAEAIAVRAVSREILD
jgi:hypothetical protein